MAGHTPAQIARRLRRHRATIGREIGRNHDPRGGYHYASAQQQADARRSAASRRYKLDASDSIAAKAVRAGLKQRWSPEQIAGRLKREHSGDASAWISHEAIYQWVYREARYGRVSYQRLRQPRKRRRCRIPGDRKAKRGVIPGRIGIEARPSCPPACPAGCTGSCVRRRSRPSLGPWGPRGCPIPSRQIGHAHRRCRGVTLSRATRVMMKGLPKKLLHTMAPDNGKEFADFKTIERELGLAVYFANPHSPWERGLNENTNGLLHDWLPKGSDFSKLTNARLAQIQKMLNNRPRKCLNSRTPLEVLNALPGVALRN